MEIWKFKLLLSCCHNSQKKEIFLKEKKLSVKGWEKECSITGYIFLLQIPNILYVALRQGTLVLCSMAWKFLSLKNFLGIVDLQFYQIWRSLLPVLKNFAKTLNKFSWYIRDWEKTDLAGHLLGLASTYKLQEWLIYKLAIICNHFHHIFRLFDVLLNFPFTTSETMRDYYLQIWYTRVASRAAKQLKTLGNITKVSKRHRMIA